MYAIADAHYSNQPSVYDQSREATISWTPRPEIGIFNSRVSAKRKFLLLCGDIQEITFDTSTDDHINRLFKFYTKNNYARVIKYSEENNENIS